MKNKTINILQMLLISFSLTLLMSCDEKLTINSEEQGVPAILDFQPETGKAGMELTIFGEQLRDVQSVKIGEIEAPVKYKISQNKMIVIIPAGAKKGYITVKSNLGESVSTEELSIFYPVPEISKVPVSGKVEAEIEIDGVNMDVVAKVFFKDTEAVIKFQNEKELIVKVPFVTEEKVDIKLVYFNENGEQSVSTTGNVFEVIKPQPEIADMMPVKVNEGETIELKGKNLHLIEKILFGSTPATILRKETDIISFRVPTLESTSVVKVVAKYYEETAEVVLQENCEVFIPKVLYYPAIKLGSHRVADIGNMFNATSGDVLSVCALKEPAYQNLIDFAGVINSGYDFTINGPQKTITSIRNYWCDGKTFITGNTEAKLIDEGYGDFISTVTRFLVLSETNPVQAAIIEKVQNGSITEISPEATPTLFDGSIVTSQESVRSRKSTEKEDITSTSIFKSGSVVFFKNEKKNKYGLMLIKKVNVDYDASKTYIDSNSSVEFDVYFQR